MNLDTNVNAGCHNIILDQSLLPVKLPVPADAGPLLFTATSQTFKNPAASGGSAAAVAAPLKKHKQMLDIQETCGTIKYIHISKCSYV